jgi:secreted trypsin-like serine protease
VLTAAHCEIPEEDFVIVGRADLSQTNVGEVLQIAEVRPHKRFDEGKNLATGFHTYDYDVALLRLERAPRTVAQLPLPEDANVIATAMTRGGFRWIAGWGRLGESNPRLPDKLQELKVKIGQDADCIDDYSEIPRPITARMFCAKGRVMSTAGGGQLADACQGDSGGPMISLDKFDKDPVLIGIISKGAGCGRPAFPGVYAKLSKLSAWVKDCKENKEKCDAA